MKTRPRKANHARKALKSLVCRYAAKGIIDIAKAPKGRRAQNKGHRKGKAIKDHAHERPKHDRKSACISPLKHAQNRGLKFVQYSIFTIRGLNAILESQKESNQTQERQAKAVELGRTNRNVP